MPCEWAGGRSVARPCGGWFSVVGLGRWPHGQRPRPRHERDTVASSDPRASQKRQKKRAKHKQRRRERDMPRSAGPTGPPTLAPSSRSLHEQKFGKSGLSSAEPRGNTACMRRLKGGSARRGGCQGARKGELDHEGRGHGCVGSGKRWSGGGERMVAAGGRARGNVGRVGEPMWNE